jgi:hypothetical protein
MTQHRRPLVDRRLRSQVAILLATLLGLAIPVVMAGPVVAATGKAAPRAADKTSGQGDIYVVQGIIGQVLDIYVDAELVLASADPKTIVGPLKLDAGSHQLTLRTSDNKGNGKKGKKVARARFEVRSGQSVDLVAHLRSDSSMAATITAYRNDLAQVGPGKLRLSVAHTAAAPPADIKVNGDVLFSNIANGETLAVVVPAATYRVEIVPTGTEGKAILGPVRLVLTKGTLTRVFAIGNVTTGKVDAVVHTLAVQTTGAAAPRSVPTGDGGQAAREFVTRSSGTAEVVLACAFGLLAAAALITTTGRRMRRRVAL